MVLISFFNCPKAKFTICLYLSVLIQSVVTCVVIFQGFTVKSNWVSTGIFPRGYHFWGNFRIVHTEESLKRHQKSPKDPQTLKFMGKLLLFNPLRTPLKYSGSLLFSTDFSAHKIMEFLNPIFDSIRQCESTKSSTGSWCLSFKQTRVTLSEHGCVAFPISKTLPRVWKQSDRKPVLNHLPKKVSEFGLQCGKKGNFETVVLNNYLLYLVQSCASFFSWITKNLRKQNISLLFWGLLCTRANIQNFKQFFYIPCPLVSLK